MFVALFSHIVSTFSRRLYDATNARLSWISRKSPVSGCGIFYKNDGIPMNYVCNEFASGKCSD
ncbi:hypothetical protein PHMEG_00012274 [Phytophthora megakarya]|uniref:Uncharacterized protein n=1 Tax=Phytophthora megakarya TaxID=4795 RepID=A0A225W942_9STRA|nr:hypothetical protein PHMEG_00012274 [Phytophthora megakarya]